MGKEYSPLVTLDSLESPGDLGFCPHSACCVVKSLISAGIAVSATSNKTKPNKKRKRGAFSCGTWFAAIDSCPPCLFPRGLHPQSWGERVLAPLFSSDMDGAAERCPRVAARQWLENGMMTLGPGSRRVVWIKVLTAVMARWDRAPLSKP